MLALVESVSFTMTPLIPALPSFCMPSLLVSCQTKSPMAPHGGIRNSIMVSCEEPPGPSSCLKLLQEVAEYSSTLIHRMIDPKFQVAPDDTARFVSRLTDLPLVK